MNESELVVKMPSCGALPAARFTVYTLGIFGLAASLPALAGGGDATFFRENGPIEWSQFGLIAATAVVFLVGMAVLPQFRHLLLLLAAVAAFACVRELDALFDRLIPLVGWKFAFLIPATALGAVLPGRAALGEQLRAFASLQGFAILWAGFIVIVPVAQLVGHGDFLRIVLGDHYTHHYKRLIEESLELLGYCILLPGGIESLLQLRTTRMASSANQPRSSSVSRGLHNGPAFERGVAVAADT